MNTILLWSKGTEGRTSALLAKYGIASYRSKVENPVILLDEIDKIVTQADQVYKMQ